MTYTKIFLCCLMLFVLGIAGCSNTSSVGGGNSSSCSGWGSGGGYSINLCTTNSLLPPGGSTTLIASVKDAQGNPVNDSTKGVSFTSSLGATITVASPTINLGNCTATYTAPAASTTTTGVDQVTASYQGAWAYVSIYVHP